jgi:RNA polymerase sigma factor (sigma-70 family)
MATTLKTLGLDFAETKSEKTFNDLYMRIKPGLLNYINQIVKDRDAAEDLFSMTMSIVYNKIDQYKPEYHISTWIYRIAYHEAIMFLRRKKRDATTTFSVFDSYYDSERGSEKLMYNNMNSDELYDEDFVTKEEKEEQLQ